MDQLEKQFDKEEFQDIRSMAAFKVPEVQFQTFIKLQNYLDDEYVIMTRKYFLEYTQLEIREFRDTLIQHMESVKKSIDKRALHKREYDNRVNERQMQITEEKDTSNSSRNNIDADDADIKPVYDEETMAEALKEGQHGQFSKVKSNKGKVKHDIDVIKTINIESDHKVAKLLKENETLKRHYKEPSDSIKTTRAKTIEDTTSLIAQNAEFKAQLQEKGFAIATLKLRKIFESSTTKVDSEPLHGSNTDITNLLECIQTLDSSAGTSINVQEEQNLDLSAGTPFNLKKEIIKTRTTDNVIYERPGLHGIALLQEICARPSTAPMATPDASVVTSNGSEKLGSARVMRCDIAAFRAVKADAADWFQVKAACLKEVCGGHGDVMVAGHGVVRIERGWRGRWWAQLSLFGIYDHGGEIVYGIGLVCHGGGLCGDVSEEGGGQLDEGLDIGGGGSVFGSEVFFRRHGLALSWAALVWTAALGSGNGYDKKGTKSKQNRAQNRKREKVNSQKSIKVKPDKIKDKETKKSKGTKEEGLKLPLYKVI
nr:hypothetical protein [Tanacetum cinerariifolium]